jgi:hypothetical protein
MKIGQIYTLNKAEQQIVELIGNLRHSNKIKTGWDGFRVVNEKSDLNLNICGFGGEFIFCREKNLFPDFTIGNTSKVLKTDNYDAIWKGKTIDVKVNRNHKNPFMIPEYAKTDCELFALFSCIYPRYRFEGFATNEMIFKKENLRQTRVMAYVLDKENLIEVD